MLVFLVVAPTVDMMPGGHGVIRVLGLLVLLAALLAVRLHRAALALFIPTAGAHLLEEVSASPGFVAAATVLRLVFLFYTMIAIFRHVLRERGVTMDTVAGAACAYMLIGMSWTQVYLLLAHLRPASFVIPESFHVSRDPGIVFAYMSFVSLTGVGGPISPIDAAAGVFVAAESLVGQLFLAIMIARLVGLAASKPRQTCVARVRETPSVTRRSDPVTRGRRCGR